MRRRIKVGSGLGPLLVAGGGVAMTEDFSLASFGRVAVIVGVILFCTDRLEKRNVASNEQYRLGEDVGYEKGYRDRERELRPNLVDLNARRERAEADAWHTSGS